MRNLGLLMVSVGATLAPMAALQAQSTTTLEEIIVTAEKRESDIQKTPIAITTISGEDLEKHGETQLNEALRDVPSLQIQSTPQGGGIYIRGVGTNGDSNFYDPAVSIMVDGAYTGRSESLSGGLYDVKQVEVLRGPQGTIYGRNSTAGAINIRTADPVIGGSTTVKVNGQFGDYNLLHLDGAANLPVNDSFAVRLAGMRETRDGYFTNNAYSSDRRGARAKILFKPSESFNALLTYDYYHDTSDGLTTVPVAGNADDFTVGVNGNPWATDPNPNDAVHFPADTRDFTFRTASLEVNWDLGWGVFTAIPTYTTSDRYTSSQLQGDSMQATVQDFVENQYTGEVRVASPSASPIKWVAGVYYLNSDNFQRGTETLTTSITQATGSDHVTYNLYQTTRQPVDPTTSSALFAQVTYPLTDDFRVTLGGRYTNDKKYQNSRLVSIAIPGYDSGEYNGKASYSKLTYKAGVEYDLARDSMLYGQISTGYKTGGFSIFSGVPDIYKPESLTAYEVGVKNRFFNNTMQLNGSVYYYDYVNMQIQYSISGQYPIPAAYIPATVSNSGVFIARTANADTARVVGAELEFDWLFTQNDRVQLTGTLSDSKYGTFTQTPDLVAVSNQVMANAPKLTMQPSYEHIWDWAQGSLTARVQSHYSSDYWTDHRNRTRIGAHQPSYWRSDANITYGSVDNWTMSAWVKNIENKAQISEAFLANRAFITMPRTYGLNVSVNF